jgi:hypothetical protein
MVFNNNVSGPAGRHSAMSAHYRRRRWRLLRRPRQGPFGPTEPVEIRAPDKKSFHGGFIRELGGSRGNTLIAPAPTADLRVTKGQIVWEYWDPCRGRSAYRTGPSQPVGENTYAVFRAAKIPPQHPALAGRTLRAVDPQPQPATAVTPK